MALAKFERHSYGMPIASVNPATGKTLKEFAAIDSNEIEARLAKAERAFRSHRATSFAQRANWLTEAADLLEREKARLARIMTLEMGKLLRAAEDEIVKCVKGCRFYAENAERFLAEHEIPTETARNFIRYEPMGPVLAIMPWNFPFWQVFRFGAPALMAGNVALLKHAANVPQCALAIEDIFRRAGFSEGVFQTLLIETSAVRSLIDDPRIKAVTLTGSDKSAVSSSLPGGKVCSESIGILRSGGPSFHSNCDVTAGSFVSGLPSGVPPEAHTTIISRSRELIGCAPLTAGLVGSIGHGGIRPAVSSSRIDSAHGTASL